MGTKRDIWLSTGSVTTTPGWSESYICSVYSFMFCILFQAIWPLSATRKGADKELDRKKSLHFII